MEPCPSCNVAVINGARCHEIGCPDAWRDEERECKWCGAEFTPEQRNQLCCSSECRESYYG